MDIRPARPAEAATLSAIAKASKSHWPYSPEQINRWHADLVVTSEQILTCPTHVAIADGIVIGFFMLAVMPGHWALEHLWVLPAHMGRGAGRALLSTAARLAAAGAAEALMIDADPHAEAFYEACGAVRVDAVAAPIEGAPDRVRPQMRLNVAET